MGANKFRTLVSKSRVEDEVIRYLIEARNQIAGVYIQIYTSLNIKHFAEK